MKKLFTLVAVALAATSAMAQETWSAESLIPAETAAEKVNGCDLSNVSAATISADQLNCTLKFGTASISFEAVSSPNEDNFYSDYQGEGTVKDKVPTYWQAAKNDNTALLKTPALPIYIKGLGNPSIERKGYWEQTDKGYAYRPNDVLFDAAAPALPTSGVYYKFTATKTDSLRVGVYINKGNHSFYVLDADAMKVLPVEALKAEGYTQNNTFVPGDGLDPFQPADIDANYVIKIKGQNRPFLGYVTFLVEAGKTYYMFNPKSQLGFYGYEFGTTAGINDVTATKNNVNAPVYNLAGQRVSNSAKGLLIQNGRKFIRK